MQMDLPMIPFIKNNKLALSVSVLMLCAVAWGVINEVKMSQMTTSSKIRIGVSLTPLSSPFLVADQLGFFKSFNLDVS